MYISNNNGNNRSSADRYRTQNGKYAKQASQNTSAYNQRENQKHARQAQQQHQKYQPQTQYPKPTYEQYQAVYPQEQLPQQAHPYEQYQQQYAQSPYQASQYQQDPYQQGYSQQSPYQQSDSAANYSDESRYKSSNTNKKKPVVPIVIGCVIAAVAILAAVWFFLIPKPFDITLNGKVETVKPGSTVASVVEEGKVSPIAGNLLAIDGEIIEDGAGEKYKATIDGAAADGETKLSAGMRVDIEDGGDVTESFTETQEEIPFNVVNDDTSFAGYWAGSIHELSDGKTGLRVTKTGDISGKTLTEDVSAPIDGGYKIYTVDVPAGEKIAALTFDDGPWPETTEEILDILEANGAKASFFTIGNQVEDYADSVRRAQDMGCEVLTHSWDHASGSGDGVDLTKMSSEEQINEVLQGYAAIKAVTGVEPAHIMRAPGGNFHDSIIETLWPYVDAEIGWDVDTEDWSKPGADVITSRIMSVQPGQVILCHDGGGDREQTVEALKQALPQLTAQGWRFVTISELINIGHGGSVDNVNAQ